MKMSKLVAWKDGGEVLGLFFNLDTGRLHGAAFLISRSPSCPCFSSQNQVSFI